jgi:hypothetical protein
MDNNSEKKKKQANEMKSGDVLRFEVLTAVKIQVEVFWFVMPCIVVIGYQRFRSPCYVHLHLDQLAENRILLPGMMKWK